MAGGTPRHHGLACVVEDLPGQRWIAGQRFAMSNTLATPQWCGDYGGPRRRAAAAATTRSRTGRRLRLLQKRAHQRRNPWQPTNPAHASEPLTNIKGGRLRTIVHSGDFTKRTVMPVF